MITYIDLREAITPRVDGRSITWKSKHALRRINLPATPARMNAVRLNSYSELHICSISRTLLIVQADADTIMTLFRNICGATFPDGWTL